MGGKRTLRAFESPVVLNHPSARLIIERELLEIFRRHAFQAKVWIGSEPKAAVERRFPQNHASASSLPAEYVEAGLHECASYSPSLAVGRGRDGSKSEPTAAPPINGYWRKGDLPNDPIILDCHERDGQASGLTQILHDFGFVARTMLCSKEGLSYECRYCFSIRRALGPDHCPAYLPPRPYVSNGWEADISGTLSCPPQASI